MSNNAGARGELKSMRTRRLQCATNREYTKAVLFLAIVAGGVLITFGKGHIAFAVIVYGGMCAAAIAFARRWKQSDPIRRMDVNLPKITFDQEA